MNRQSSAIARVAIAIKEFWREGVYIQEKLLELPGRDQGALAWQRGPDGPRLVGRDLALNQVAQSPLGLEDAA